MSGLERLIPLIYHEKQQSGSQLCAQHALNAILQGDYFSAPDLAQFAHQLDTLEGSFNNDAGPVSNNMDDTGFFSVQVLEGALRVWGFTLVRWRSQDMRDHQENPHTQMAFVLNYHQHWFTLRRFGSLEDPESGHWFNLNSFLKEPEWVGKLYLGMVLSQAEDEGYSVFAVLPASDAGETTTLPHTEADDIAATLPQPTSAQTGARLSTSRGPIASDAAASSSKSPVATPGFEDEDLELQAALQASLTGAGQMDYAAFAQSTSAAPAAPSLPIPLPSGASEMESNATDDPIAASLARNKAIMQRMQREQEMALREGYEEEVAQGFHTADGLGMNRRGESSRNRDTQAAGNEDEAEAVRKAIEESKGDYGAQVDEGNEAMDVLDDDWRPSELRPSIPADRVYDDEDSQLQAALKASLEGLPDGFVIPSTPPRANASSWSVSPTTEPEKTLIASETAQEEEVDERSVSEPEIDAEEMRRRRLARFGG